MRYRRPKHQSQHVDIVGWRGSIVELKCIALGALIAGMPLLVGYSPSVLLELINEVE